MMDTLSALRRRLGVGTFLPLLRRCVQSETPSGRVIGLCAVGGRLPTHMVLIVICGYGTCWRSPGWSDPRAGTVVFLTLPSRAVVIIIGITVVWVNGL